jgi:hypothetical protein
LKRRAALKFFCGLVALLCLARCATYAARIGKPRQLMQMGQYDAAIDELKKYADAHDNDELLYLMELGLTYHAAGRYADAIPAFLRADKLAEIKDYTSITQEAGAVILNDDVKPYKGEDFEKILIHVYLAMDYTLLHKWEDALVECRRVNRMLDMMISKGKLPYEQNAFAKYLSAALFEARGELNDSLVDYRTVLKWRGVGFPYLPAPLLRLSERLAMSQEYEEFRRQFPTVNDYKVGKGQGQVVLLLEVGKVPVKVPNPSFTLVPMFQRQAYSSDHAWLRAGNGARVRTYPLYDIETTAIKDLENRTAGIIAKKLAGYATKEVIAAGIAKETKSEAAGLLTSLLLHATDHADLRSWSTLPARLELARLVLPAGRHDLVLDRVAMFGGEVPSVHKWTGVEVKPGETVFLIYRMTE